MEQLKLKVIDQKRLDDAIEKHKAMRIALASLAEAVGHAELTMWKVANEITKDKPCRIEHGTKKAKLFLVP